MEWSTGRITMKTIIARANGTIVTDMGIEAVVEGNENILNGFNE